MASTVTQPIRNVYGTGTDLQNAKNALGATGGQYNFIDTGKAGFTLPTAFSTTDMVLGGTGTVGGIAGDIGSATRLWGATSAETKAQIDQYAQPLTYVNQVNNAINQSQTNRAPMPTYNAQDDINSINQSYAQQQQAVQTRLQGQTDVAVSNLQRQSEQARPQYQNARNQVDVTYNQQLRQQNEQLASQGLKNSGKSLTAGAILGASRVNQIGSLTSQEQKMIDDTNFQIQQLKNQGATEQNAQILELEARKNDALTQARQRSFDNQLQLFNTSAQISQQDLTNMINGIQFAYGVSKDQAQTLFQKQQFDYQKAQDLADQKFKQAQFDYQQTQDKIDNAFKERQITDAEKQQALDNAYRTKQASEASAARLSSVAKSGSSSSKSGGSNVTQADVDNAIWSQFYKARDAGNADAWLSANRSSILSSGSSNSNAIYQQMYGIVQSAPKTPAKATTTTPAKSTTSNAKDESNKFIGGWIGSLFGF